MNLQESIRRILREEDFIPLEDLYTVIKDYEDGFDVFIMNKDKKIGEISFAKEDKPNQYTIVDATIDDEYKGNRIYSKTIINLFKERPNIIINSVFRSPEAEKAWKYLLSDLPSNIEHKVKYYEDEETTLYQLKLKNLQESIRRILKEETDSVKNLNESKTSQHLKLMNNLLDPFKEKDCICDIRITFDVEENYYDVYLVFGQEELHEKFFDLVGIRTYIQKMMNEVKVELESFLPIRNVFIGNYTKPNCEWSPLNESENKKSGLLKAIEEDGLYEVITSTSLHIHEIEQKVGQLSREILERFIIDVVKENHSDINEDGQTYYIYLEDYPFNEVPVGNNDYVEELKVTNNELFFVVSHFEEDKYGELEFSSKELIPSNNLEYDNIYEIAGQMGFLLSKGLI